ncbi:MAG TPA: hypothetical protein VJU58_13725 [Microbacterium sp.]|nr:hypothetical protein [Microbacterium sp.]
MSASPAVREPLHIAAVRAYNLACGAEGVSAETWRAISRQLHAAADELTGDNATFVRDRAKDAAHQADWVTRRGLTDIYADASLTGGVS